MTASMSGRQAQAARNDEVILASARAVFVADPGAPIAAVAEHAGVGISALYRRYASKEELLRKLCLDGLHDYIAELETALADEGEPWSAFAGFMRGVTDADTHSLTQRLAGTFTPTEELTRESERAAELTVRLFERTMAAGVIRPDLEVADLSMLFEQLTAIRVEDPERIVQLRHRYLALILDSLRVTPTDSLPGPPPTSAELGERWVPKKAEPAKPARARR
ncbi:TetR/AcrR family transcriptional regulator [Streptosporangium sp. KLBMP 9127]|nr:TetR/AcrR family transcriptional regulator [Streptosporangium sp. KLBMP 9127]